MYFRLYVSKHKIKICFDYITHNTDLYIIDCISDYTCMYINLYSKLYNLKFKIKNHYKLKFYFDFYLFSN